MYKKQDEGYRYCGTCKYKLLRIKEGLKIYTCNNKKGDNYKSEVEHRTNCKNWEEKRN